LSHSKVKAAATDAAILRLIDFLITSNSDCPSITNKKQNVSLEYGKLLYQPCYQGNDQAGRRKVSPHESQ
jgi:hypothetical protein